MSNMWGANADELDVVAAEFEQTSEGLRLQGEILTRLLSSVDWVGAGATQYLGAFAGVHMPRLRDAGTFLNVAARDLKKQASQQREASEGAGSGNAPGPMIGPMPAPTGPNGVATVDLETSLANITDGSSSEQAQWWNSLTDQQQELLIEEHPDRLLGLDGLPSDALAKAESAFLDDVRGDLAVLTNKVDGKLSANVWLAKLEGGFGYKMTEFGDGHIDVTFGLEGGVGNANGIVSAMLVGGVAGTYTFGSRSDYESFVQGLKDKVIDKNPTDTPQEVVEYLQDNKDKMSSVKQSIGVEAETSLGLPGIAEGSAELGLEYTRDVVKDTHTVSGQVELAASGPGREGSVTGSGKLKLDSSGTPTSLTIGLDRTGTAEGMSDYIVDDLPVSFDQSLKGTVSQEVVFDLTDPYVAQKAQGMVDALTSGDVAGAVTEAGRLADHGQVTVTTNLNSTTSAGFDAKVVSAELTQSITTNAESYTRPPGGEFIRVN